MRIIIEGADGVGKTTLVNKLAERYNLGVIHCHSKDPNDLDFYYQLLRKNEVIYDRHLIGEMVYPKIFGRPQKLKEYELEYLLAKSDDLGVSIIILTAGINDIEKRLFEKDEFECVLNNIEDINNNFLKLAGKYNIPVINTSNYSIEEVFEKARSIIDE